MLQGDSLSLARLITLVERESPDAPEILRLAGPHAGGGHRIGFTGPPGSGKSTLVDQVTGRLRAAQATVGVIAVDPSSPFSGGALLGDRIRMERHYRDSGVYIRSMGTRGGHGGLPSAIERAVMLVEASGKEYVLVETVGVGQTELDVMDAADTVVVVLVPEAGDTVQTMKAGLMEIGDIFVVNKADRDGADKLARGIETSLHLSARESSWTAPVLTTQANEDVGTEELIDAVSRHREASEASGELADRRRRRMATQFFKTLEAKVHAALHDVIASDGEVRTVVDRVENGEVDPYTAATEMLRDRELVRNWLSALDS